MKKMNAARILRLFLILLALTSLLVATPSSISVAEIIDIPLDQAIMPKVDPSFYLSDTEYKDESLHIVIGTGRMFDTDYMTADIQIANASQIRTALATANGKGTTFASTIAKRVNAVLAINSDYYMFHASDPKHIVRQGVLKKHNANGDKDALIIDENGDFTIIRNAKEADFAAFENKVINSFAFGPALVVDGVMVSDIPDDRDIAASKQAKRMCIAQVGKLHYMVITSEGPEEKDGVGMTIYQFAELVASLGVQNAYNLDGGSSATLVFNDRKINALSNPKTRPIADIIYFASAYSEDEAGKAQ